MKLARYTTSRLSILLLVLIAVWGTLFYFAMTHEIMDETDDELESYRKVFIARAINEPDLLSSEENIFHRYKVIPISEKEALNYKEKWEDIIEYWPIEDEHIPMRVYKSVFQTPDGQYYELDLRISTLERDDMLQSLLIFILILYALLIISISAGISLILKKSFIPLQNLLLWLQKVTTGKPIPPLDNNTKISEFRELGEAALTMSKRNAEVYEEQKQFIENASHELQTPLAVALNKIELLAENEQITEQQLSEIDEIYKTLNKAVKLNKSLLLLTKINNKQFPDVHMVNFNQLIKDSISDIQEISDYKKISLYLEENAVLNFNINESLAQILVSNLIKNAVIHNKGNSKIIIKIDKESILIKNSGEIPLNPDKIFKRFYRSDDDTEKESTGLGLAIVYSISGIYNIGICYNFDEGHEFLLKFP